MVWAILTSFSNVIDFCSGCWSFSQISASLIPRINWAHSIVTVTGLPHSTFGQDQSHVKDSSCKAETYSAIVSFCPWFLYKNLCCSLKIVGAGDRFVFSSATNSSNGLSLGSVSAVRFNRSWMYLFCTNTIYQYLRFGLFRFCFISGQLFHIEVVV